MSKFISLVIHGGAGALKREQYTDLEISEYESSLNKILDQGVNSLKKGENAIDVVQNLCVLLENNEHFNAGRGSVFNSEGEIEMDASIMDGSRHIGGGVTGLKNIKNPILAARAIMDHSPHTLLSGAAAEEFCKLHHLELEIADYFKTSKRYNQFLKAKSKNRIELDHGSTVGAVARDLKGHLAAATSTGGMTCKYPGRVSDSAIIGAGTFANEKCAISGTGTGDQFILGSIAQLVAFKRENMNLEKACEESLLTLKKLGGNGGLIAVDIEGEVVSAFNSLGMFRGSYSQKKDEKLVKIFR